MSKRRKYEHDFGPGWTAGYSEYRYGPRKPISLAKVKPVHSAAKREHLISAAIDRMRDWRDTPFENEGPMRAGLRSAMCLQGHGWRRSDDEAAFIVSAALRSLAARRPTWEQGQPDYTDSPDFCSWCRGPMDEEGRTRGQRFCSAECARMAIEHRNSKSNNYRGMVLRSAYRLITKEKAAPKPCEYCGKMFKSDREDARFCSTVCGARWSKGDRLLKDIVCEGCGKTCKPANRGAKFCSHSCAAAERARLERERLVCDTRICGVCGDLFTPTADRSMYCSTRCSSTAASRLYYQRNRAEHHLVCQWCGEGYVSKMPWSTTCSRECRAAVNALAKPTRRPRPISPPVFDYITRMAA